MAENVEIEIDVTTECGLVLQQAGRFGNIMIRVSYKGILERSILI